MNPTALIPTYDRPVPVHTAMVSAATSIAFDRSVPVHSLSISTDAYVAIYDRPTPVYDSVVTTTHAATYENITTVDPTQLKAWDGAQWVRRPYYVWNGSTWTQVT